MVIKKKGGTRDARIYFDYAAGTPVRPEISSLIPELLTMYANPSSIHTEGVALRALLEKARKRAAQVLGALPSEIHFTSGSTEGVNLAIQGIIAKANEHSATPHVITSAIEHPAILETLRSVEEKGVRVEYLTPGKTGIISHLDLRNALNPETLLVAFSLVNSEIGVTAPLKEYTKELRVFRKNVTGKSYPYVVIDATQAPLYYPLNVHMLSADILVLDGGKMGGLKGSGILYINRRVEIAPILFGGGQEKNVRPGTQNVLGIETLVTALELAANEAEEMHRRLRELSSFFIQRIQQEIP